MTPQLPDDPQRAPAAKQVEHRTGALAAGRGAIFDRSGESRRQLRFHRTHVIGILAAAFLWVGGTTAADAPLFEAHSKREPGAKMDIVVKEIERRPRASVLEITVYSVGSSVGSSFFLLCSIRQLARLRGGYRHVVKPEEHPRRGQMLIGFLRSVDETPVAAGAEFAGAAPIELEQFAPICDVMK